MSVTKYLQYLNVLEGNVSISLCCRKASIGSSQCMARLHLLSPESFVNHPDGVVVWGSRRPYYVIR